MKEVNISVTEAARNFAECVNRAHYKNVTFGLLKNGSPVARLAPAAPKICLGRDLAEVLSRTTLPEEDARAWHRDLQKARKTLCEPSDPGEFDALIDEGINSEHFPLTDSVWKGIRQRGTKLARKMRRG
jgi:antitoxin (DNA-binding transcriptional repressor) of toxin-antitoxin stability system